MVLGSSAFSSVYKSSARVSRTIDVQKAVNKAYTTLVLRLRARSARTDSSTE